MRFGTSAILSMAVVAGISVFAFAGDEKSEGACCGGGEAACTVKTETVGMETAKAVTAKETFESIKGLAGKYSGESKEAAADGSVKSEFKVTAGGSVVMETMMPGSKYEMVNAYHLDGDNLIMTHYCAQGIQPRMKMASNDGKTIKFDFLDCTNLPSKDTPHMHDMTMTIDGEKVSESWGYFKDGKVEEHVRMALTKQK